jgi:hypothetical protein
MAKLAHKAVDYGPGHPRGDHCAVCTHFEPTGPHCTIVADPIKPLDWCNRFARRKAVAKLTAKTRNALPGKSFAGPDRSYPIEDKAHARNALSRVSQHGSSALKAKVRAKVHSKYPAIAKDYVS